MQQGATAGAGRRAGAFTLVEAVVAAALATLVVGGALASFIFGLRSWQNATVKCEIQMDLEGAMERIRQDLRLSSVGIGLMAFYPAGASEYTAISFPMSAAANGLLQRDSDGKIRWTHTVIYHVLPGTPDQLRRTVFTPRKTNATPNELYVQLQHVVQGTNLCLSGEAAGSEVVFQNLVNLAIRPPELKFDGYAPAYGKAEPFTWGSVVLSNGMHQLKFTIEGRNTNNTTGYKIGLDRFSLSASGSWREGELYLPPNSHPEAPFYAYSLSGGSVAAEDMSSHGAGWSGDCQLTYQGAAVSNALTLSVQNDLWCDAQFNDRPGVICSNVSRKRDTRFTNAAPGIPNFVVSMDKGTNWTALGCTLGEAGSVSIPNTNPAVVNVIYGGTNVAAGITLNGEWVRLQFQAGTNGNLYLRDARIARQASGTNAVSGTAAALTFGGSASRKILSGTAAWSDWVPDYPIDRECNYLVQFNLQTDAEVFNNAQTWASSNESFMASLGGVPVNTLVGLSAMEVRYPDRGLYRSCIFDTRQAAPAYRQLHWTHIEPWPRGDLDLRVRTGALPDLSDASPWLETGYFQNNADNNLPALLLPRKRYIQYEAQFLTDATWASSDHTETAILRDVVIDWDAPTGLADLRVDFSKGPDHAIVSATVDGQPFVRSLELEMTIFKHGPFGTNTATGTLEIRPLNTNK